MAHPIARNCRYWQLKMDDITAIEVATVAPSGLNEDFYKSKRSSIEKFHCHYCVIAMATMVSIADRHWRWVCNWQLNYCQQSTVAMYKKCFSSTMAKFVNPPDTFAS